MSSFQSLGQMFIVGFLGITVPPGHWVAGALAKDQLGGVLLFDRNVDGSVQNIQAPEQLAALIAELRKSAAIPPLVAIDQEGGAVCRLKETAGFAPSLSAKQLAEQGLEVTRRQSEIAAQQLAALGINLNFAPVVDLDLNPNNPIIGRYHRSFGADPNLVTQHAQAVITAHHAHGVACCLKHFPGHGSAGSDSHLGFVDTTNCWQTVELEPYRLLVRQGYADGIMSAHLVNRTLDPTGLPATLSSAMLTGLLRQKLGFPGVIFSDDLQMRAISNGWTYVEAVQQAVLAGVDMLVVGNNLQPAEDAVRVGIQAIAELLDSGRIDGHHIASSLQRIKLFKEKIAGKQPWTIKAPPITW